MKRLIRNRYNSIIGGVCAGLADSFDLNPLILRLLFIILFFIYGIGLIPYLILWILMPSR